MHVVLGVLGHVVVHHQVDVVDVDAPADHVGGHQDAQAAVAELQQHLLALALLQVGVHGLRIEALALQVAGQVAHLHLAACEHDDGRARAGAQDVLEDVGLLGFIDHVGLLVHALGGLAQGDGDLLGVLQDPLRQFPDLGGHRGAEHQRLAILGQELDDAHDVVDEAHVHHPVGLVQHQELEPFEMDIAQVQVAEQLARGGDDHLGAARQRPLLLVEGGGVASPVDRYRRDGREVGDGLELLVDLQGQLPCRHDHQGPDAAFDLRLVRVDDVDEREEEGRGLAGAGLCAGDQVLSLQRGGDGLRLHGCGGADAHGVEPFKEIIADAELVEIRGCVACRPVWGPPGMGGGRNGRARR